MTTVYLIRIRNFILFAMLQALVFSRIHLFGYATVYIYLLFLLKLPRHTSCNELLIWGFLLGLTVDMFGNTPGINAAAATVLAFTRNSVLENFIHKGNPDNLKPGVHTISWGGYMGYTIICILIFNVVLYLLDLFSINYPLPLLISVASSTVLTMLFVVVTECFTRK
ncbi:MAG: rod shape-determining protein MreD [Bacteroidaceae bacterium]|nr:rod shape-determining protein MreD [Bacteroidaceae bacterium]MBR7166858.1 rod shape-determining protein MreD [Bacteroidaceae bacterium]